MRARARLSFARACVCQDGLRLLLPRPPLLQMVAVAVGGCMLCVCLVIQLLMPGNLPAVQFTRFVKPGSTILSSSASKTSAGGDGASQCDRATLAALQPGNGEQRCVLPHVTPANAFSS